MDVTWVGKTNPTLTPLESIKMLNKLAEKFFAHGKYYEMFIMKFAEIPTIVSRGNSSVNKQEGVLTSYTVVAGAHVPVLTFICNIPDLRMPVDVTVNQIHGLQTARLLRAYVRLSERCHAVMYTVLKWAEKKAWKGARLGGLSSYAIELLVAFLLIHHDQLPCLQRTSA
ncbi:hypothetical protein MTO96_033785, partial [Rhipicephalus appendiculatus]